MQPGRYFGDVPLHPRQRFRFGRRPLVQGIRNALEPVGRSPRPAGDRGGPVRAGVDGAGHGFDRRVAGVDDILHHPASGRPHRGVENGPLASEPLGLERGPGADAKSRPATAPVSSETDAALSMVEVTSRVPLTAREALCDPCARSPVRGRSAARELRPPHRSHGCVLRCRRQAGLTRSGVCLPAVAALRAPCRS